MCKDCNNIPRNNKETEVIQWRDDGSAIVIENYCIYDCKSCGQRVVMTLGEQGRNY